MHSMISNPNLVFYACIAKGPAILAEFSLSKEAGIEAIAQQCIDHTPPHHAMFSHTVCNRTYMFLIDDPFTYFAVLHENLPKSESFWFLNRVKTAFEELLLSNSINDFDKLSSFCFQGQFYPVFRQIMGLDVELSDPLMDEPKDVRTSSVDSTKGKGSVARPLLAKPTKLLMKKKKRLLSEANGDHRLKNAGGVDNNRVSDVGENGNVVLSRDFSVSVMQKNGGFYMGDGKQKAKQIWRKHVWVVLILDLVICAILFGIWLWVCRGFKCIDG